MDKLGYSSNGSDGSDGSDGSGFTFEQKVATTTTGAKGSDVYTLEGVGNDLVALNTILVRGADKTTLEKLVNKITDVKNLFILTFMTRAVRGGKGERDLFYTLYGFLLELYPELSLNLLDLVGHYGYWGDLFKIVETLKEKGSKYTSVWNRILHIIRNQLLEDTLAVKENTSKDNAVPTAPKKKISLLAKWLPREGQPFAKELALDLWVGPTDAKYSTKLRVYRKTVASINKALATVEVAMCKGGWEEIKPDSVPGRCLKLNRLAFLNEKAKGKRKSKRSDNSDSDCDSDSDGNDNSNSNNDSILRHPNDPARMACREHFQEHFKKTASGEIVSKGADTTFPHEIIRKVVGFNGSIDERNSLTGMWKAFVTAARTLGGLGRSIPMCDFSGSMQHSSQSTRANVSPLEVSRAMGLLISEVTSDEFRGRMLTFDSVPSWLTFADTDDIFTRVNSVIRGGYGQGTSTDFQKAMDLVLGELKRLRVPPGKEPENLIVLTDMAWDEACASNGYSNYSGNSYRHVVKTAPWQTHIQMIREAFKRAGEDMFGEGNGYKPPRIVIWNISSACQDMHAKANEEGVVMLSGWSPSLFKVLVAKGVEVQTPEQALAVQLNDPMYDLLRERIAAFYQAKSS